MMMRRIHIFGASGAGTSTLGRELARRLDCHSFDTDEFFWRKTDPPYQQPNDREERKRLLFDALIGSDRWVLAGSLCGWGDEVIPLLNLAVFVITEQQVRLQRLREREARRFGPRIVTGGDMHGQHQAFLEWASQYDTGSSEMRSRKLHEQWLKKLRCNVCRVDGALSVEDLCGQVMGSICAVPMK
jgi:adenylate kinase family enzyme